VSFLLTILLLLNLYLPVVLNQGTEVRVYVENDCGPLNDAYVELTFQPGGEVIQTGTGADGLLRIMGPKSTSVTFFTYGQVPVTDITSQDNFAEFFVHYTGGVGC
jgi:hypothetical protein